MYGPYLDSKKKRKVETEIDTEYIFDSTKIK